MYCSVYASNLGIGYPDAVTVWTHMKGTPHLKWVSKGFRSMSLYVVGDIILIVSA